MSDTAALALLTDQVRRSLSLVTARATARCFLDRLELLGTSTQAGGPQDGQEAEGPRAQHAVGEVCAEVGGVLPGVRPQ